MATLVARLFGDRRARGGLVLVGFLLAVAILAPLLAPHDPIAQPDIGTGSYLPPSPRHPFGTDFFSRDVLSRVLFGARVSFLIAIPSVLLSVVVGTAVGMVAGSSGGAVDATLMRLVDAGLAIPRVFLLLVVLALWERVDVLGLVIMLGLTSWLGTSRIVRGEALSLQEREFIAATRSLGLGRYRTLVHHLLPNVTAQVSVTAALGVGHIVLIESGLSYLGLGIQEPTASLGRMMQVGTAEIFAAPWISVFPGAMIVLIVIGFSLIGDGLRDATDPRSS